MYKEKSRNNEVLPGEEQQPRVYPMGFIPQLKQQLLSSLEQRQLATSGISQIGQELRMTVDNFAQDEVDLPSFLEKIRKLNELIKDGEAVYKEERDFITHALRTDEELAVIFAKVSRNPGSFEEIARGVTEEGAAQFHQKWVVSVEGYGHASVAEHAIIHLAVENVPSLDGDWVTDNRLASFTEFSARFKGRQGIGYFTPEVVAKDSHLAGSWHRVHQHLFAVHDQLMAKGGDYIITDEAKSKAPDRRLRDKTVADQFKDLMPASRLTSMGVTMNAREAENAIRKMLSAPYPSLKRLGQVFKEQSLRVAPTLVKYAEANEYLAATRRGISSLIEDDRFLDFISDGKLVDLIEFDERADDKFIAAAVYQNPRAGSFRNLMVEISALSLEKKKNIVEVFLGGLGKWDVPIRALEMPGDYVVEFPGMTYGAWRDYKRHRLQFYQAKDLDVRWGYRIPPLAWEMDESQDSQFHGCVEAIKVVMGEVEGLFMEVAKVDPYAAQYAVTRLHYRPAVAKFNIRELYHLLELRTGPTAHPYVRQLLWPLFDQVQAVQPILMEYLRLRLEREDRPPRDFIWSY